MQIWQYLQLRKLNEDKVCAMVVKNCDDIAAISICFNILIHYTQNQEKKAVMV
jgi:hypothetical protein